MDQTLIVSTTLYDRLQAEAQLRGKSIEQLIEEWEKQLSEIRRRQEAGLRIKAIHRQMAAKYGEMPDSAALVRADRDSR